jgi:hypothetical protein
MDEIMEMDDEDVAEELGMDRIGDAVDYATGYPYRVVQLVKLYHELSTND